MGASAHPGEAPYAALGLVRGVAGGIVNVEILNVQGGGATVDAPAVHTVAYAPGDRVLVLYQSDDLDWAIVAGRVGNPSDAERGIEGITVNGVGDVGVGTEAPQGRLHVWTGNGGALICSRTAIGATAQTLIPSGAGTVSRSVRSEAIISSGTTATYSAATLTLGGSVTQNVTVGSDIYQVRLNSDGSLDIRRTSGSNTGNAIVRALWL